MHVVNAYVWILSDVGIYIFISIIMIITFGLNFSCDFFISALKDECLRFLVEFFGFLSVRNEFESVIWGIISRHLN